MQRARDAQGRQESNGGYFMDNKYTFSIVDVLVGVAVLMILAALFVPDLVNSSQKGRAAEPAHQTATVHPGR